MNTSKLTREDIEIIGELNKDKFLLLNIPQLKLQRMIRKIIEVSPKESCLACGGKAVRISNWLLCLNCDLIVDNSNKKEWEDYIKGGKNLQTIRKKFVKIEKDKERLWRLFIKLLDWWFVY